MLNPHALRLGLPLKASHPGERAGLASCRAKDLRASPRGPRSVRRETPGLRREAKPVFPRQSGVLQGSQGAQPACRCQGNLLPGSGSGEAQSVTHQGTERMQPGLGLPEAYCVPVYTEGPLNTQKALGSEG